MEKIIFFVLLALASADHWVDYKEKYNLKFDTPDDDKNHENKYYNNRDKIINHNADETATYMMAENKFTHLDYEEFAAKYLRALPPPPRVKRSPRKGVKKLKCLYLDEVTTEEPFSTSENPITDAPVPTTRSQVLTTNAPIPTTKAQVSTTNAPISSTNAPTTISKVQTSTTNAPVPTTKVSTTTTSQASTTKAPTTTTSQASTTLFSLNVGGMTTSSSTSASPPVPFGSYNSSNVPSSINYQYLMRPIFDQNGCGSCWATAIMAQLEGLLKYKDPSFNVTLSPQYLVSCDSSNYGCSGGWPLDAMTWLKSSTGGRNMAPSITTYPYTASDSSCKSTTGIPLGISSFYEVYTNNEETMKLNLANYGPQVICFWASNNFQNYAGGIFRDNACFTGSCGQVNHAVVAVGYGTDPIYGDYWLMKNSWGSDWGENGYFRIARNRGSMCNIACRPMTTRLA